MLAAWLTMLVLVQGNEPARGEAADTAELARLEETWDQAHLMARSGRMRFERYETSDLRVRVTEG